MNLTTKEKAQKLVSMYEEWAAHWNLDMSDGTNDLFIHDLNHIINRIPPTVKGELLLNLLENNVPEHKTYERINELYHFICFEEDKKDKGLRMARLRSYIRVIPPSLVKEVTEESYRRVMSFIDMNDNLELALEVQEILLAK